MVEEMTSYDRVMAVVNKKPVDRAPVMSGSTMVVEYIRKSKGKWPDFHSDPKMMLDAASLMHTDAGLDNIVVPFGMFIESKALGLEVGMGKEHIQPSVMSEFKSPDEVEYGDFLDQPPIQTTIDAIKMGVEEYPDAAITPFLVAPVTLAGHLMGTEKLALKSLECLMEEEQAKEMNQWLDIAVDICKVYAGAVIEAGAELLYYSDASASSTLVMPDFYHQYGVSAEKEVGDFIHSKGANWELHICGDTVPIMEDMVSSGADLMSVEQAANMKDVTDIAGNIPVAGNVTPLLMVNGTKDQIVDEVTTALDRGAKVSMLGCGTPPLSQSANIKTWVQAVKDYYKV
jgi:[methyl-Co(III) methanol-specific corrinoid protein]:coenzyme M methyltransferase